MGSDGFEGGIPGLNLSDLVQLNAQNRFTGRVRVEHEGKVGLIFFRDGEILHAEEGQKAGEDAFCEILEWRRGRFGIEPNVLAARRTIHKSCEHLLLEAHRLQDERGGSRSADAPQKLAATPPAAAAAGIVGTLERVPGVAAAVFFTSDGKRLVGDGYQAEVLAGQAAYLRMVAAELGTLFQAGELRTASAQGSLQHLLLYANKTHCLGVSALPEGDMGAVDIAVRNALVKGR